MKFRINKTGWLSYNAEATENGKDWIALGSFCTKRGAKEYCVSFAEFCKNSKDKIVEEFEIET